MELKKPEARRSLPLSGGASISSIFFFVFFSFSFSIDNIFYLCLSISDQA